MFENPETLEKTVRKVVLLGVLHQVGLPVLGAESLRMNNTGLLATLVGIDSVIDCDDVVQLVNGGDSFAGESLAAEVHVEHRLNSEHLALGLVLETDEVGPPPDCRTAVQRLLDERCQFHDCSRVDSLDAPEPSILPSVKVQSGDHVGLALRGTDESESLQFGLELFGSLLAERRLGDLAALLLGLMT